MRMGLLARDAAVYWCPALASGGPLRGGVVALAGVSPEPVETPLLVAAGFPGGVPAVGAGRCGRRERLPALLWHGCPDEAEV